MKLTPSTLAIGTDLYRPGTRISQHRRPGHTVYVLESWKPFILLEPKMTIAELETTVVAIAKNNEPAVVTGVLTLIGKGLRAEFPSAASTMETDLVTAGTELATAFVGVNAVITDIKATTVAKASV